MAAARAYDAAGADELCFLDITASHENRDTIFDVVARTAEHCFMPLTVGGGVRTTGDIRKLLLAGADKVSINTAAVNDPDFVAEAADKFGNQCIVVAIDAKRVSGPDENDRWEIFTHGGRRPTGLDDDVPRLNLRPDRQVVARPQPQARAERARGQAPDFAAVVHASPCPSVVCWS